MLGLDPTQGEASVSGRVAGDLIAALAQLFPDSLAADDTVRVNDGVTWAHGLTSALALCAVVGGSLLLGWLRRPKVRDTLPRPWKFVVSALVRGPLFVLLWAWGIYWAALPFLIVLPSGHSLPLVFGKLFDLALFSAAVWAFWNFTTLLEQRLLRWAGRTKSRVDDVLVPIALRSLRVVVPALAVIFALPLIDLPARYETIFSKGTGLVIIAAVSWILWQVVTTGEKFALRRFASAEANTIPARKFFTQIKLLKRVLLVLIVFFTVASMLMVFDEVRRFGTSILASAGVVSVILGFAAQRTISNLFAGFQIALTQPIRIGDAVIVEGESGRIEEITLTYVVVQLWDLRRLIIPINQFIEKPFQNWTRSSSALVGVVFLYVDYSAPVEIIRAELKRIVAASPLWDQNTCVLQVTEAKESALQLRCVVSSEDAGKNFELRCEVREKLIAFIHQKHPGSLPKTRRIQENINGSVPDHDLRPLAESNLKSLDRHRHHSSPSDD
jgi:small-conductance mechanosensitive channel